MFAVRGKAVIVWSQSLGEWSVPVKNKYLWAGSVLGAVLVLDQLTKHLVEQRIRPYGVVTVIPGFFNLTHVWNKGAAFSILATLPDIWRVPFFVSVTLIAVVMLAALVRRAREGLHVVSFSLIMGGALGNVIDRVRFGEVVDFIQWYVKTWYWPSFNVADSAITIGVVLLAVDLLFRRPQEQKQLNDK